MRSFTTNLVTALTIGAIALTASNALAGGKGGKGGKGGGGVSFSFGGGHHGHHGHHHHGHHHHGHHHHGHHYQKDIYYKQVVPVYIGQAYEPFHCTYFVQPGDTFYAVSLKEYGTSACSSKIALFNRLPQNVALVPGQQLMLPSVSASGQLSMSRSPAAEIDPITVQAPAAAPTAKFIQPQPRITVSEPSPIVPAGSLITLDGQMFGNEKGTVRLNVGGTPMPAEIVEWTLNSTKIRLPMANVTTATDAEIEVVRADGSLVSKSAIVLTPSKTGLALGN